MVLFERAPKLKMLNLQGCYGLDGDINILEEHVNFEKPSGRASRFVVDIDTTNACLSRSIVSTLQQNERVQWNGADLEDDSY